MLSPTQALSIAETLIPIEDKKGVNNLLKSLKVELKLKNWLGIIVDADVDPMARWRAIQDRLRESGYRMYQIVLME